MKDPKFYYGAVRRPDGSGQVVSVLAYQQLLSGRLRAVKWSVPDQEWIYAPAIVSGFLFDPEYQDLADDVDRPTAERLAREVLGSELPDEQVLTAMFDEGQAMGWDFGPPGKRG